MKPKTIFTVIMAVLAALFLTSLVYTIVVSGQNKKLSEKVSISEGKNMIYAMEKDQLIGGLKDIQAKYVHLQGSTEASKKIYESKLAYLNKAIKGYEREKASVGKLSANDAMDYFKVRTQTSFDNKVITAAPDTTFETPIQAIQKANQIFVEKDQAVATVLAYRDTEAALMEVNKNLQSEINNRQSVINDLTTAFTIQESQLKEYAGQVKDKDKIILNQKRKVLFQRIGLISAGAAIVIAVIL